MTLPDQQIVWIVRNGRFDPYGEVAVNVNGIQVDVLPYAVSRFVLTPGAYHIVARHMSHDLDKFAADGKAEEQAFVEVFADVDLFATRFSLRLIPEDEGRRKVLVSKLIKDASIRSNP